MEHGIDQGTGFGHWDCDTAELMYWDVMPVLLNGVDTTGLVADYGGANGILKNWIPEAITIDNDPSKEPDIEADILEFEGEFDLIAIRYVLHYLTDAEVIQLFDHLSKTHRGRTLVIQFVNDDLDAKLANSVNETKYFRKQEQLEQLLPMDRLIDSKNIEYTVSAEFYKHRLDHPNPTPHREKIVGYYFRPMEG